MDLDSDPSIHIDAILERSRAKKAKFLERCLAERAKVMGCSVEELRNCWSHGDIVSLSLEIAEANDNGMSLADYRAKVKKEKEKAKRDEAKAERAAKREEERVKKKEYEQGSPAVQMLLDEIEDAEMNEDSSRLRMLNNEFNRVRREELRSRVDQLHTRQCWNCGNGYPASSKFCPECGKSVK